MAGVFPDTGLVDNITAWLTGLGTLTLHLARNNVTITRASVLTDFTEANFSGYAAQTIGAWGTPVYDATNHRYNSSAPPLTFLNSTGSVGNSIYAVYITNVAGHLVYAEEVTGGPATPVDMTTAGKAYIYQPVFDDSSRASTSP
jgi:hypothetical protein